MHQLVTLPPAARVTVLPPEGGPFALDYEVSRAEPSAFSPIDQFDIDNVSFDWARRGYSGDAIISANITSVPAGINIIGQVTINGALVSADIEPARQPQIPAIYSLRCSASFASSRISSFSVPIMVAGL